MLIDTVLDVSDKSKETNNPPKNCQSILNLSWHRHGLVDDDTPNGKKSNLSAQSLRHIAADESRSCVHCAHPCPSHCNKRLTSCRQMVFDIISAPRGSLSLNQLLDLANVYLENARKAQDPKIALVLCHDTEISLAHVKKTAKNTEDKTMHEKIATVYIGLGELLDRKGHSDEAKVFFKKSEKWGGSTFEPGRPSHPPRSSSVVQSIRSALHSTVDTPLVQPSSHPSSLRKQKAATAAISQEIFPRNVRPPAVEFKSPEPDSHLKDTPQLVCCLALLQSPYQPEDILVPDARKWLQITRNEPDEQERLKTLATDVIRAFKRDELKDPQAVTEVVYLAPVLEKEDFRYLLKEFTSGVDQSRLLDIHQLEGLANLVQGAHPGYLDTDDLVEILKLLNERLGDTHGQSTDHLYRLTLAVSRVLDAMADAEVKDLDREKLHEPLGSYLDGLKGHSDPYLVYQAAYAYQALLYVPDNETAWQETLRRTSKVIQGVSSLVSAVKSLDLNGFIEGLGNIGQGLAGVSEVVKTAYEGVVALAEGGQGFFESLKEGLSFERKCAWYAALRGADTLIRDGQLAEFRRLVCEAPCRRDMAFQWGVCQRLGDIAANSQWDLEIRRSAIEFLGEIFRNDAEWGQHARIKQWTLSILMQLSSRSVSDMQFIETLLQELGMNGNTAKRTFYRACRNTGSGSHPLNVALPAVGSPSLLDRVQERPDVEGNIRQLRRQRLKERDKVVYIPPQAKANLQARDEDRFSLMDKIKEYLASDQKVFLLLGDSGAGKTTFNREFECDLWKTYEKKTGAIPLHINLPAIDKPEQDMIAKQLRKSEFTEPQIRELKQHRRFILICDGYDESQQTQNLYISNRLNEQGEWKAKMVISCRSEYLGTDYRDRFQPGDRNKRSEPALFQEAVITPFSLKQVQDYITQYVSVHRPLWEACEYKRALENIPSLKELVKNPFLMSLSLEVLPRMVDPGQDLTVTHITRVALYDQFIEHWLERGKKRLGEKNLSPQARSAFESLIDEGFTRNGIDYLKRLSMAIYKEQGGQPIVEYSRYKDENSWKSEFFSREDEKQLLREACPMIRSGNQHRFIHRSLLEYGIALAAFDPQEWKEKAAPEPVLDRRGSMSSLLSINGHDTKDDVPLVIKQEPSVASPLFWRSFISDPSVLQFLEERAKQEPLFKEQLHEYIEHSKTDKKWRTAAANAITILVRAGVPFNSADLRDIQIPKADLSYGTFDSAQLQGADLRQVNLRGVWLRQADLSQARMTGVLFGELPFLKQESEVLFSVNSPDWKSLAVAISNNRINVYSILTWDLLVTLDGHSNLVTSIAYSPTSRQLASGSRDKTVRLWDTENGVCRHILSGHHSTVESVAYSPHGDQIATSDQDSTVRLWDVETGECRYISIGHTDTVPMVMYSPKGHQIASCSWDGTVRLWNNETAEYSHTLSGHQNWIESIAYSPQGETIASASYDHTVKLWDTATGDCQHTLTGHNDFVFSVTYSPRGDQLASAGYDNTVRLWDIETGVCLHTLPGHSNSVGSIVFSRQGDMLASASWDRSVRLWDVETGICRQTLNGHSSGVANVLFLPEGNQVISTGDMTVRLWDVGTRAFQHVSTDRNDSVGGIEYSSIRNQVACCSIDNTVRLWDVETETYLHTLRGHTGTLRYFIYSPREDQIATCSADNTVRLWNVETGSCTHTLTDHSNEVNAIAYSPQGDRLASVSHDKTIRLWDVKSGECQITLEGHTMEVNDVAYSPKGSQIASCSFDKTVRLWNVDRCVCDHILIGHFDFISDIKYSPQGDRIASAGYDSTMRVWDVESGECRRIIIGHEVTVNVIKYSPKGDQIASGDRDGNVRLWDLESGTSLQTSPSHSNPVIRIVYSPQGGLLASCSNDDSVRLWDVASGQCRAVIQDFRGGVNDIAWVATCDVCRLVTGCGDGSVRMWKVREDEDRCHVSLLWSSLNNALVMTDAIIQDVHGLSQLNMKLMKQRGAVGEPVGRLREASKKLASMTSVVSKLSAPSIAVKEDPTLTANVSTEQLEQRVEKRVLQQVRQQVQQQVEDAKVELLRDMKSMVSGIAKDIQE